MPRRGWPRGATLARHLTKQPPTNEGPAFFLSNKITPSPYRKMSEPTIHTHIHGGHSHDGPVDHGHSHEILDGPGSYLGREPPIFDDRNWSERAFTVGIGG